MKESSASRKNTDNIKNQKSSKETNSSKLPTSKMRDLSIENTPEKKPKRVNEYQEDHIVLEGNCNHREPKPAKMKLD